MRRMRGMGPVAAGVVAGLLLVGCGSGGEKADAKPSRSPSPSTAEPSPEPSETFPDTPAGRLDELAVEMGWVVDEGFDGETRLPSEYVADVCEGMQSEKDDGGEPGQWLAEEEAPDSSLHDILKEGMPDLCPKWSKTALAALEGDYKRHYTYSGGTYKVAAVPGEPDPETGEFAITPGTYRTEGDLEDCYWERTSRSGEIIDNNFATSAQEIKVTIRSSDGQFTSEGCGIWEKVE